MSTSGRRSAFVWSGEGRAPGRARAPRRARRSHRSWPASSRRRPSALAVVHVGGERFAAPSRSSHRRRRDPARGTGRGGRSSRGTAPDAKACRPGSDWRRGRRRRTRRSRRRYGRNASQVTARGAREHDTVAHRSRFGSPNSARTCSSSNTRPAATSASASASDSRMPDWDSQNNVSCSDSHSSAPISTAAGGPFLVIVACSRVVAASTSSLSLSLAFEIGSVRRPHHKREYQLRTHLDPDRLVPPIRDVTIPSVSDPNESPHATHDIVGLGRDGTGWATRGCYRGDRDAE